MPHIKKTPFQIAIALDQLRNTLCGGWADETLSSRTWRLSGSSKGWHTMRRVIDAVFFWQDGHCEASYQSEVARRHLPEEQR